MTDGDWLNLDPGSRFAPVDHNLRCGACKRIIAPKAQQNHEREHLLLHLEAMAERPPDFEHGPTMGGALFKPDPGSISTIVGPGEVPEWVHLDVMVEVVTDKAVLVTVRDERGAGIGQGWAPKSQLQHAELYEEGSDDVLVVRGWLAERNGGVR